MNDPIYHTKKIITTEGVILIACVGFTDDNFKKFCEVFFPREGYGILRLDLMKQVDNNSFGSPEVIVVPDTLELTESDDRIITVTEDKDKADGNALYFSDESKDGSNISYIEEIINIVSCDALHRRRQKLFEEREEEISTILNDENGIDINRLMELFKQKDETTFGHVNTVAELAGIITSGIDIAFCNLISLSEQQKSDFVTMAFIHDIGKLLTPDQLLKNEGRFVGQEYSQMKRHIEINCELAENEKTKELLRLALKHHYRYDGAGYPDQQSDEIKDDIPIEARMLAVIDAFDAITDPKRIYQPKPDAETKLVDAINILYNKCHDKSANFPEGGQFDPKMSYAFLIGFRDKFISDSDFRHKWIEREGLVVTPEDTLTRATTLISLMDEKITKLEEEFGFGQASVELTNKGK